MMGAAGMMTLATGLTIARLLTRPGELVARDVSRVLVGGVLATAGVLAVESRWPEPANGLAALVLTTSVLVHGVPLSQAATRLVGSVTPPPPQ